MRVPGQQTPDSSRRIRLLHSATKPGLSEPHDHAKPWSGTVLRFRDLHEKIAFALKHVSHLIGHNLYGCVLTVATS